MSRRKFTTTFTRTFMCDIYIRPGLFSQRTRLGQSFSRFPMEDFPNLNTAYTQLFFIFAFASSARAKPELSHIFIYRAVSYFRLELSRFTSFPVTCSLPPPQNWIMFSDSPHGDALSYSNRGADSSLSAGPTGQYRFPQ